MRIAVVVLAGGAARRWGGRDKTAVLLAGRTVLEHAVEGLRAAALDRVEADPARETPDAEGVPVPVVVAGPSEHAARPALVGVRWVREDPAGGGPVSGLAAAVRAVADDVDVVVVGAGDAPFAGTAVPRLLSALHEPLDGAVGVDASGRRQPLLAAYRLRALRSELAAIGDPAGVPLGAVVGCLQVAEVPVTAREALDLDTPAALDEAERQLGRSERGLGETIEVPGVDGCS